MRLTVLKNHVPIHDVMVETPDLDERYEIFVGRSEDCHVQIEDPLISRHHFALKNVDGKWICEKLSTLGIVSVNGSIAPQIEVKNGDEIKCGNYSVLVSELAQPQPAYVPPPAATPAYVPEPTPEVQKAPEPIEEEVPVTEAVEEEPLSLDELDTSSLEDTSLASEPVGEEVQEDHSFDAPQSNEFNSNETSQVDFTQDVGENIAPEEVHFDDPQTANFDSPSLTDEGGISDESTRFFKAFVNYQLVLFGEHAPYDRFQIDQEEIFIGRDAKKCQIVLNDPEVSSVHAVLKKSNIDITLEDLNSSNGTILNGERINKAHLSTGDEFVIGSTSFTLETRSDLLEAESDRLMPVEQGQVIEKEEIEEEMVDVGEMTEVDFNSEGPPEKSIIKRIWKDPVKRKKAIYALAGVVLLWVLFGGEEEKKPDTVAAAPKEQTEGAPKPADPNAKPKIQLSKELEQRRNTAYELGVSFFDQSKYFEALKEFQTVMEIDPTYKKIDTYFEQTKAGLKKLEELEAQRRAEEERIKTKKEIEELLVKAKDAVKEKKVTVAENLFAQITKKDPENIEVQQLKMELEAWQKEQERLALEKAAKEAARKAMVDALNPGKTFYLKKEWYRAILKLEEFLRRKGMDEDLVKEGSDMLSDAKEQLSAELGPLVGKARSLKEGQDLRSAYEAYLEILKVEPTNAEALNEVDEIRAQLDTRSKRIYREAIIAESLSLFNDAKEKFQEVQQISPTDSEYYRKASDKLKNYLE